MSSRRFGRISLRCRVPFIVFVVLILPVELIAHSICAREYYYLNVRELQVMALTAVKIGADYLPTDPRAAVRVADAYVQSQGIAPPEIVFTQLSSDNSVLTIRLDRKIPSYVAVLAMGGLPARDIDVTASAWQRGAGNPFGIRILDVPVSNGASIGRRIIAPPIDDRQSLHDLRPSHQSAGKLIE